MQRLRLALVTLLIMLALMPAVGAQALEVPQAPTNSPVLDQAELLTPDQEQRISAKITSAEKETGNQVGVLTIKSLEAEVLEEYSIKVARAWGIGSDKRDSGALILVAKEDRRVRIEVGYGLEGALPDIRANQIITTRMTPAFAKGDYYGGIDGGVDGVLLAVKGERDPQVATPMQPKPQLHLPWELIMFGMLIVPSWLAAMLGRTKRWWPGGVLGLVVAGIVAVLIGLTALAITLLVVLPVIGLVFDRIVSNNYQRRAAAGMMPSWWAGGGHIGGGSDSWGGFGGGGFGGGGASGDW